MKFAGLALNGGRKERFFYCVLNYFPNEKRWALVHLGPWEGEAPQVSHMAVDFPLGRPHCEACQIICPGESHCPQPLVQGVRQAMCEYLGEDRRLQGQAPKNYEYGRLDREQIDTLGEHFWRVPTKQLMSRSFKRKLKKGYLPYWNRPIDFWVWSQYYDQLLEIFNYSYDSFGHTSLMLTKHFEYLKKHLPSDLQLFEANNFITMIELFRSKHVSLRLLRDYQNFESQASARLDLIKIFEKNFGLFVYAHDLETMVKNPRAFESLLLAWAGTRLLDGHYERLPQWANGDETHFLVPKF